jgi:hypothetical protein
VKALVRIGVGCIVKKTHIGEDECVGTDRNGIIDGSPPRALIAGLRESVYRDKVFAAPARA